MKADKVNTVLLALIFVVLLLHLVLPLFRTQDAVAVNRDNVSPAERYESATPAVDAAAGRIADGLHAVAQANQQIANAISQNAAATDRVAVSVSKVADEMGSSGR